MPRFVPDLRSLFLVVCALVLSGFVEAPSPLPSQARPVQGVVMPVPKEIFRSLDQFSGANWHAVQKPEIAQWKSQGDEAQIAILLGVVVGEGFVAMEAQDPDRVKRIGASVLKLARGLGVEESALRRSRSIMDFAESGRWTAARQEWDGVLSDLESGMVRLKSVQLAQLVSIGGWLRGSEALSSLVLQQYSPDRAELLRQPVLAESLEKQLQGMSDKLGENALVTEMITGIRNIRALMPPENQPVSEQTVQKIHDICARLVALSPRRPS